MFDFKGYFTHGVKPHVGAFLVVTFVLVVFVSAPFLMVYRAIRSNVPGATALPPK